LVKQLPADLQAHARYGFPLPLYAQMVNYFTSEYMEIEI